MTQWGPEEREETIRHFASRMRFPKLALLVALLFVVDLVVPDPIPFIDEIVMGLMTVLLARWRERPREQPRKNVTPKQDTPRPGALGPAQ